jgi:hypothetical protein
MVLGLGGTIVLLQPVQIDFRLVGVSPPVAVAAQPQVQAAPAKMPPHSPAATHLAIRPPLPVAGFGHDVPLEFAVRQLVPASMRVEFGDTVDRQLRVSWQGGQPWEDVLRAVTMPIRLRVVTSSRTVRITE